MNKNYTLKELADIGAVAANLDYVLGEIAREAFTKAILDAIGYKFPKDEELEAFDRWLAEQGDGFHPCGDVDKAFAVWKAGREELRRSINKHQYSSPERMNEAILGLTPKEPAWIPWVGGECPVSMNCRHLEVRFRDGEEYLTDGAYGFIWTHSGSPGDILAYRVWK